MCTSWPAPLPCYWTRRRNSWPDFHSWCKPFFVAECSGQGVASKSRVSSIRRSLHSPWGWNHQSRLRAGWRSASNIGITVEHCPVDAITVGQRPVLRVRHWAGWLQMIFASCLCMALRKDGWVCAEARSTTSHHLFRSSAKDHRQVKMHYPGHIATNPRALHGHGRDLEEVQADGQDRQESRSFICDRYRPSGWDSFSSHVTVKSCGLSALLLVWRVS